MRNSYSSSSPSFGPKSVEDRKKIKKAVEAIIIQIDKMSIEKNDFISEFNIYPSIDILNTLIF